MFDKKHSLSRRQFIKHCMQLSVGCAVGQHAFGKASVTETQKKPAPASPTPLDKFLNTEHERRLAFYNLRTGEKLNATFWVKGEYIQDQLADINHLLRDFRQNKVIPIDLALLNQLFVIQQIMENKGTIQVISGYRSPETNNMLVQKKQGAVKNSYHTKGQAVDLNIAGVNLEHLHKAALVMKGGGVGYYPKSQFIHIDTGPVRRWGG